ncbi:glucuronate isomerase [Mariniflexile litorale]|uniref:Uronate isomerase n=1 Tax=Mariniflexile litorale TaxID=3045158 RepID=A0AAU7EIL8_9FLAO|nr:glucuronate isomerase [Mariniflexile sp. KMM 9835]MDQ8210856.1 glucuronate isomerase [Mariniflexile sp. KMM 9835]
MDTKHSTIFHEDFLLRSEIAKALYHNYAKDLPIIDYHNHLPPENIAKNHQFENCSQVWLAGDHYKWRAMRTLGIDEKYITGNASDREKFQKWGEAVPYTLRNPLYHWSHLELKRYYGIDELLTGENANTIYDETMRQLQQKSHSTRGLLEMQNVEVVCTTEDPLDDLRHHKNLRSQDVSLVMSTAFRPDKAFAVEDAPSFLQYLEQLEQVSAVSISNFDDLLEALDKRIDYFHENGCRLSDHGLELLPYFKTGAFDIIVIFNKIKNHKVLSQDEINYFKCETLKHLCKEYHKRGWVQQFHLGALRSVNSRMLQLRGRDSGWDSIGDFPQARSLGQFLNYLDSTDQLTKTILYNLNPADNELIATMIGNFNDGSIRGKIQFGAGWWFLDQKDGMEKQMNALSNMGLLSCFVGMLTDSRSFMSFPRHEYFRRILCNLIGNDVTNGELPADEKWLGKIISDISYYNAKNYFNGFKY